MAQDFSARLSGLCNRYRTEQAKFGVWWGQHERVIGGLLDQAARVLHGEGVEADTLHNKERQEIALRLPHGHEIRFRADAASRKAIVTAEGPLTGERHQEIEPGNLNLDVACELVVQFVEQALGVEGVEP